MFSLGVEASYARRPSWPGVLNEIVQMYMIVQYINWKKFHYLEGSEIEITSFVNARLPMYANFSL